MRLTKYVALALAAGLGLTGCRIGADPVNLNDEMRELGSSPLFATAPPSVLTIDRQIEPGCSFGSFPPEYSSTLTFEGLERGIVEETLVAFYGPIVSELGWRPHRSGGFENAIINVEGDFGDEPVSAVLFPVASDDERLAYSFALSVRFVGVECVG